jgi:hypothetical protein
MQIEKTKHVNYKDKLVSVEELSLTTRKEIDFYDYLRDKVVVMEREMKVYLTALATQQAKIKNMVDGELSKSQVTESDEQ